MSSYWARAEVVLALALPAGTAAMHSGAITGLAVDAAGRTLATASEDGTVRLWTLPQGRERLVVKVPPLREGVPGTPLAVALSPDGRTLVYGGLIGEHAPRTVDGQTVHDHTLQVHAASDGRRLREQVVPAVPDAIGWSPSGAWLWASSSTRADPRPEKTRFPMRALSLFAGAEGARLPDFPMGSIFAAVAAADPHGGLLVALRQSGTFSLHRYDAERRLVDQRQFRGDPAALAFAPDGTRFAASTFYGDVSVHSTSDLAAVWKPDARSLPSVDEPRRLPIAWSADGRHLFVAGTTLCRAHGCAIRRYDTTGQEPHRDTVVSSHAVTHLAALPDGGVAFGSARPSIGVLGADGQVRVRHDAARPSTQPADAPAPIAAQAGAAPASVAAHHASPFTPPAPATQALASADAQRLAAWRTERTKALAEHRPQAALAPAREAYEFERARLGVDDPARIDSLIDLAQVWHALAPYRSIENASLRPEYDEALRLYERALELARAHGLRERESDLHRALADLLAQRGDFDRAFDSLHLALAGRPASGDQEATLELLRIAKQLAPAARSLATPVLSRLLQLRRTLPSASTAQRAAAEALLADVYGRSDAGLVGATLRLREQALSLHEQAHGPRHGKTLAQAVALARASSTMGRPEAAVNTWALIGQVLAHALGEGHDLMRRANVERARALRAAGQNESALPLLLAELDLAREAQLHSPFSSQVVALRNAAEAAAAAQMAVGNAAAARALYAEVLAGRDTGIVMNKARVMPVRLRLAEAHRAAGDADAARAEYQTVLDLAAPDLSPPDRPGVSLADALARSAHEGLALMARDRGDIGAARRHGELAAERDDHIVGFFSGTGTSGREALAAPTESHVAFTHRFVAEIALHDAAFSPTAARAFELVLNRKGVVFELEAGERERELALPVALRRTVSEWAQARIDLASALHARIDSTRAPNARDAPTNAAQDDELVRIMERTQLLRGEVDRLTPQGPPPMRVRAAEVAAALPEGTALVEFLRVESKVPRYVAFTLTRGGPPRLHDLGPAATIDLLVGDLQHALRGGTVAALVQTLLRELHQHLWEPLGATVDGAARVLVSPDGELSRVPFAALADRSGQLLIERQRIGWLTSARSLVMSMAPPLPTALRPEPEQDLVLLANPKFGTGASAPAALPGTAAEARSVPELLRSRRGQQVLTGADANARALLAVRNPRVLHVATHGVHLERDTFGLDALGYESLLARSALLLAADGPGAPASYATALDISGLDLRATQLVALSACDSGAGSVTRGQGVLGLSRAFALAGAQNLLLSLWTVEDAAAAALVADFYRRLADASPADALHEAQLVALARQRAAGQSPAVASWAAFVLQGRSPFTKLLP